MADPADRRAAKRSRFDASLGGKKPHSIMNGNTTVDRHICLRKSRHRPYRSMKFRCGADPDTRRLPDERNETVPTINIFDGVIGRRVKAPF